MNFFDKKVCTGCNCRMSMRVKALEKSSIEKGLYFFIDMKKFFMRLRSSIPLTF